MGQTCQKLDPFNDQVAGLIKSVQGYKHSIAERLQAVNQLDSMQELARTNPANVQNLVILASAYLQMQDTNRALALFDTALARPEITVNEAQAVAQYLGQLGIYAKLGTAYQKVVDLAPDQPEPRLQLAVYDAVTGHPTEASAELKQALDLSAKRRAADPKAPDLADTVRNDPRLAPLRNLPDFPMLVPPK